MRVFLPVRIEGQEDLAAGKLKTLEGWVQANTGRALTGRAQAIGDRVMNGVHVHVHVRAFTLFIRRRRAAFVAFVAFNGHRPDAHGRNRVRAGLA